MVVIFVFFPRRNRPLLHTGLLLDSIRLPPASIPTLLFIHSFFILLRSVALVRTIPSTDSVTLVGAILLASPFSCVTGPSPFQNIARDLFFKTTSAFAWALLFCYGRHGYGDLRASTGSTLLQAFGEVLFILFKTWTTLAFFGSFCCRSSSVGGDIILGRY